MTSAAAIQNAHNPPQSTESTHPVVVRMRIEEIEITVFYTDTVSKTEGIINHPSLLRADTIQ